MPSPACAACRDLPTQQHLPAARCVHDSYRRQESEDLQGEQQPERELEPAEYAVRCSEDNVPS
jgi:hypothetical protein